MLSIPLLRLSGTIRLFPNISTGYYILMGFVGSLLFFLIVKDLIRLGYKILAKLKRKREMMQTDRRDFLKHAAVLGMGGSSALISGIGFYQAMSPNVKTIETTFKRLPAIFDGTTVAQISDLHIGPIVKREYVQSVVSKTNALDADFIAITGDLVDGRPSQLRSDIAPLRDLKAKHAIFYVTGNHEYYWGAEEWRSYLANELGMQVLSNERAVFERNGHRLIIAGVEDHRMGRRVGAPGSDPLKAKGQTLPEDFKLLLAHQPKSCFEAQKAGFDYMICGHTHGGQYFPINLLVYLFEPYVKGLYHHQNMKLYVSTGSGFWGPPNRFGVKNEIAHHVLRSGA